MLVAERQKTMNNWKLPPQLVKVKWLDSRQAEPTWERLSDTHDDFDFPRACPSETVGWLIKESNDSILLAQSLADKDDDDPMTAGRATIARCQIIEIKGLYDAGEITTEVPNCKHQKTEPHEGNEGSEGSERCMDCGIYISYHDLRELK